MKRDKISPMEKCAFDIGRGMCACGGACPYTDGCQQALECDKFAYGDIGVKTSAMAKQAAWKDVSDKAKAIVASGGVAIVEDNAEQIRAYVMSGQVADRFPVTDGGPYEVILAKRTWDLKSNVGGWIQGYLCDCKWGYYNSGQPGNRWQGRFCSHAYAALLEANARARGDFMRNKAAGRSASFMDDAWFDRNGVSVWIGDVVEFEGDEYEILSDFDGLGYRAVDTSNREWGEVFLDKYDIELSEKVGRLVMSDYNDFDIDDEPEDVRRAFDELVEMLRSSSYEGLSQNLDAICRDPKLLQLLRMGFGSGEFAELSMDGSMAYIPVGQLNPMQNEIGLPNSLAYPLSGQADPEIYFQSNVTVGGPIVTLNGTYIIDGHHRWSQLYMMNPDAAIEAVNYTCSNPDPEDALRVFQGAIAATHGTVPHSDGGVANVYAMSSSEIYGWIDGEMVEDCELSIIWHTDADDRDEAIQYLVDNAMSLPKPSPSAPDRKYMPQTDELSLETIEEGYEDI